MSRYSISLKSNPNTTLNFGFDRTLGYFYDIFNETDEVIIEEQCSLFNNLQGYMLANKIESLITNDRIIRFKEYLQNMKVDLPF